MRWSERLGFGCRSHACVLEPGNVYLGLRTPGSIYREVVPSPLSGCPSLLEGTPRPFHWTSFLNVVRYNDGTQVSYW